METSKKTDYGACSHCGHDFAPDDEKVSYRGDYICTNCESDDFDCCYHCGDLEHNDDLSEVQGDLYCDDCRSDNFEECYNCGDLTHNDDIYNYEDSGYCRQCYEEIESEDWDEQDVNVDTDKFLGNEAGKIVKSSRIFSAEIECYYPDNKQVNIVKKAMPKELGITGDGSLGNDGIEFQTPRLRGLEGENFIKRLCGLLKDNEYSVDKKAGLHIHLDGGKKFLGLAVKRGTKKPELLKTLFMFYLNFDDVLMSMLPYSRRDNTYCVSLTKNYSMSDIMGCKTLDDLEELWYKEPEKEQRERNKSHKYNETRYSGINFHSLLSHNHLEIRFHGGTINPIKILYWIKLHTTIMDMIESEQITIKTLKDKSINRSLSDKTNWFMSILRLDSKLQYYILDRQEKFCQKVLISKEDEVEQEIQCVE